MLADSQSKARGDVEGRFGDRAKASAVLTGSLFGSASASAQAENARKFGGPRVSPRALAREARQAGSRYMLLLSQDGKIIAASPGTPIAARRSVQARPAYLRQLLQGRPYALSNMQRAGGGRPSLVFGQSFKTASGLRVLMSGLDARLISSFLGGSLKQIPNVEGGRGYVVDQNGVIVASPLRSARPGTVIKEPGLLPALAKHDSGTFATDKYFAAHRVPGTPWRVVLTAPKDRLFASVSGPRKFVPWILLIGFGVAGAMALVLLRKSLRRRSRAHDRKRSTWSRQPGAGAAGEGACAVQRAAREVRFHRVA